MRRVAKWFGWALAVIVGVPLLLAVLVLIVANTGPGRRAVEALVPRLTGDTVRITGLSGRFPDAIHVAKAELRDPHGTYATIADFDFDWSPLHLLHWQIDINRLSATDVDVLRMPASSSSSSTALPAPVVLHDLDVARVDIGAPIAGTAIAVSLHGSGAMSAPDVFRAKLDVRQLGGTGNYTVTAASDPTGIHATVDANEPEHGLLAELADLPELGSVAAKLRLSGPRDAVHTDAELAAGPLRAVVNGMLDLQHQAADVTIFASAPAMRPRPDLSWQSVALDAHVRGPFRQPEATGRVRIAALSVAGSNANIAANISGNAGMIQLRGQVSDLRLPAPNGDLLAHDPVTIDADARLAAPDRPVQLQVRHPLFTVDANAQLGAAKALDANVRIANLTPFAAIGQVDLQGGLALHLHAASQGDLTSFGADGTVGITGGQQQAHSLIGDAGKFSVAAKLQGDNLTLSDLQFNGQGASLSAHGSVAGNQVDLGWTLAVSDLAAAEQSLAGKLQASGRVSGTTDNLGLIADISGGVATRGMSSGPLTAHIVARGLPNNPSGEVTAQGQLLDAPLDLAVDLQRLPDGFGIDIQRANWKSLQAGGELQLPTATMVPTGNLHVAISRLADLAQLTGQPLAGSLDALLEASAQKVHLTAKLTDAELGRTAAASRIALQADVDQPQSHPSLNAKLDVDDARVSGVAGTVHATADGPADAVAVKLTASLPDLHGAPAGLSANAVVDAMSHSVRVASLQGEWRRQTVRLLQPVSIGFANGISIDQLRLGIRQAVLEVSGHAGQSLDLTASIHNLPADIGAIVSPEFAVDGAVQADARITGTSAHPAGRLRFTATGIRMRTGQGRALPPANLTASAELNGIDAGINAHLGIGSSQVNLNGRVPLAASGQMNLRAEGTIDVALLNPMLTASGRRARGKVSLDSTVTGALAAPRIAGTAQLTGGEVQDYSTGIHLTGMTARLLADGDSLRIAQFSARAGSGTIEASGSVGVLQTGLPVSLTVIAHNAKPLASDLISAVVDANLTLHGEALGQLAVGGDVRVQRADIRVPERMPTSIAVLPVRLPGSKPAPARAAAPSVISLNLTLDAPRQVYVRGRGLDVEFGGAMKVGGTLSAPRTSGALELRRGSLDLAGRSLNFTEGRIGFDGGSLTDPTIHLVATSSTADVVATLAIDGTADKPKITLSSTPALPQDEVLAHLLFGSGVGKLGALEVAEIASGLATLTGVGGGIGDPLDQVRQGLGLDRLSVTNGAGGSPALEAGRYIAPRVYLGAKQTATGASQATVQVDITKGLKLEGTAGTGGAPATAMPGTDNGSSIGLTYQFQY